MYRTYNFQIDMKHARRIVRLLLFGLLLAGLSLWGALALYYSGPGDEDTRISLATLFALSGSTALVALVAGWRRRGLAVVGFVAVLGVFVGWWQTRTPSNDRDWRAEEAVLPYAEINGEQVTVHNIRNFTYRSETDFDAAHYDKTFDLAQLRGVDLVAVYWMGPAIAHVLLSFDFGDDDHLAFSIEVRKEKGEAYSTLAGFFRQYELYYVVADERDVLGVRTHHRKAPPEDVYLYRVQGPIENARRVFMQYIEKINALKERPEWYNTLTTNCTTNIWTHARVNPGHLPLSWKVLASGYVPEYLYENGRLDTRLPFAELQRQGHINARAQAAAIGPDYSRRIRALEGAQAER